jgi:hypothetical protein
VLAQQKFVGFILILSKLSNLLEIIVSLVPKVLWSSDIMSTINNFSLTSDNHHNLLRSRKKKKLLPLF